MITDSRAIKQVCQTASINRFSPCDSNDSLWYGDQKLLGGNLNRLVLRIGLFDIESGSMPPRQDEAGSPARHTVRIIRTCR